MQKNHQILVFIILIILALGLTFFGLKEEKTTPQETDISDTSTEWGIYKNEVFNFSFSYPTDSFVEEEQDAERFLRLQNYDPSVFSRGMDSRYWVEFFAFEKDAETSTCPRDIVDYETVDIDGATLYKGYVTNELGGTTGLRAMCADLGNYDLYAQGQDETNEDILGKIFDSVQLGFIE